MEYGLLFMTPFDGVIHSLRGSPIFTAIIQSDIRMRNILLSSDMDVKIWDFGFAALKARDHSAGERRVTSDIGYWAQETRFSSKISLL
jgi:serine/threonine protein kinase